MNCEKFILNNNIMETLKKNIDTQKKISIVNEEIRKLETVLEKKINENKYKVKNLKELHKETMNHYENILNNLQ
jgi:hypothetical protein